MLSKPTECYAARKLRSHSVTFGSHRHDWGTDYRQNLRQFSQSEVKEVRGAMAEEVRKDLRAVHYHLGMDKPTTESCAMHQQRTGTIPELYKSGSMPSLGASAVPQGSSNSSDAMRTALLGGDMRSVGNSDYREGFRRFSPEEQRMVRGAMAKEVQQDLRAVHYELGHDKPRLESDVARMTRMGAKRAAARGQLSKDTLDDLRAVHYQLGTAPPQRKTTNSNFRRYSQREMDDVRGAMSEDAQKDLRAVHYELGFKSDEMYNCR